jgi:type IV pilus assembly protein PilN
LPEKLWLTSFSEKGGLITLSGVADDEHTVARFMQNLEASDYYQNIELTVTEQSKVGDNIMKKFTLSCAAQQPSTK